MAMEASKSLDSKSLSSHDLLAPVLSGEEPEGPPAAALLSAASPPFLRGLPGRQSGGELGRLATAAWISISWLARAEVDEESLPGIDSPRPGRKVSNMNVTF